MEYIVRRAKESEKYQIALTIAHSFKNDFSNFAKNIDNMAKVFESGVDIPRFVVAEKNSKIVGIIGRGDCNGRALNVSKKACRKHLGFIRGSIAFMVFKEEFMQPLICPATTGYIDLVGVLEEARGQGIAKAMLRKTVEYNPEYAEFILNVTDINTGAIKLYEGFGFAEFERKPYKWAKQAGFKEKIWMRYTKEVH